MRQIVITIEVPDGVSVAVGNAAANGGQAPAASGNGPPACPKHGAEKVKDSKFGGFYCTAADDSGPRGYCVWKSQ